MTDEHPFMCHDCKRDIAACICFEQARLQIMTPNPQRIKVEDYSANYNTSFCDSDYNGARRADQDVQEKTWATNPGKLMKSRNGSGKWRRK